MIREQRGDIFSSEDNLAHCVSMDFAMFKGVAKEFKSRFGVPTQKATVGQIAVLRVRDTVTRGNYQPGRLIFFLVTKGKFFLQTKTVQHSQITSFSQKLYDDQWNQECFTSKDWIRFRQAGLANNKKHHHRHFFLFPWHHCYHLLPWLSVESELILGRGDAWIWYSTPIFQSSNQECLFIFELISDDLII